MLLKSTQEEEASQVRVTPQEFAEAVSALEARRVDKAARNAESVAIGETIDELGLDVSADEVLAEIRSKRDAATATTKTTNKARRHSKRRLVFATMAAIFAVLLTLRATTALRSTAVIATPVQIEYTGGIPLEIAKRQHIWLAATLDDLHRIANHENEPEVRNQRFARADESRTSWVIVPDVDGLFVRGWRPRNGAFTDEHGHTYHDRNAFFARRVSYDDVQETVSIRTFANIRDPRYVAPSDNRPVEGIDVPRKPQ